MPGRTVVRCIRGSGWRNGGGGAFSSALCAREHRGSWRRASRFSCGVGAHLTRFARPSRASRHLGQSPQAAYPRGLPLKTGVDNARIPNTNCVRISMLSAGGDDRRRKGPSLFRPRMFGFIRSIQSASQLGRASWVCCCASSWSPQEITDGMHLITSANESAKRVPQSPRWRITVALCTLGGRKAGTT